VPWRITDRATFESLRRSGARARSGPLTVVYLSQPGPIRVAYAIGRRVGCAVDRNRLRRRLREAVRSIESEGALRPGSYLVVPAPHASKFRHPQLLGALSEAMVGAQGKSHHKGTQGD
jgi:ribonuclease P protein component